MLRMLRGEGLDEVSRQLRVEVHRLAAWRDEFLAAGIPMKVVSDRLGHSSMSITADLYTHVVPVLAREAATQLAASISRHRRTPADPNV